MSDTNVVILVGRLTRDSEMKYTASGTAVAKLGLAVNRRVKKGDAWEDEASFFDVSLWGKQAESLSRYLTKGKQVAVTGELRQDRWEQDGQKRSRVEIAARDIQLLSKGDGSGQGGSPTQDEPPVVQGGFDDDIPF